MDLYAEWERLLDERKGLASALVPYNARFAGYQTCQAEHERSRKLALIKERIRLEWPVGGKGPTDDAVETRAKSDPSYGDQLLDDATGRVAWEQAKAALADIDERLERIKSMAYQESRTQKLGL